MLETKDVISISVLDKFFIIKWRMTEWCNYHCSYCIRKNKLVKELPKTDKLFQEAEAINGILENKKRNVRLKLIGGEVSFLPLKNFLERINSSYLKAVTLTTNLSNKIDFYKDLAEYSNLRGISLNIVTSYHDEFADEEEYFNKVNALGKVCSVQVEIVVNNENKKRSYDFLKKLKSKNIKCTLDFDANISDEDKASLKEEINDIMSAKGDNKLTLKTLEKINCSNSFLKRNLFFNDNIKMLCNTTQSGLYITQGYIYDSACINKNKICSINELDFDKINKKRFILCDQKTCSFCTPCTIRFISK